MIFKKPYAFLIKYFKLINLIISLLVMYITYRTYNIISFFNEYIDHDYSGNFYEGFFNNYISNIVYIIIFLIIIGILGIVLLFSYKKKPIKAYIVSIVYYILLIIFLTIIKNVMITLETSVITAEVARIYRDLSMISILPQIFFSMLYLLRSLGFNIGKFNFKEDLKELEINEQDSEEIELTFKQDGVKLKRNLRRFVREFQYYIKENKFIFTIICIVSSILLIYGIYSLFPEIIDLNFNQGEIVQINNLIYKVEDSIITNINYNGEKISEKKYYVVLRLNVENSTKEKLEIDYNNFRLEIKDYYIYPSIDKGINFIDYAENYYGKTIKGNSKQTISLVYEIKESEIRKNYKIKISNGQAISNNEAVGKFNYISITPIVINTVTPEGNINVGEELKLLNSNLGNSSLKISNFEITDKYIYKYESCYNEKCEIYKDIINIDYTKNINTLLILDYEYVIDKEVPYYRHSNNVNTFMTNFGKIKYIIEDEEYYLNVNAITPSNLKEKIVLEVSNKIKKAEEIFLTITIRNKEYLIKLK